MFNERIMNKSMCTECGISCSDFVDFLNVESFFCGAVIYVVAAQLLVQLQLA